MSSGCIVSWSSYRADGLGGLDIRLVPHECCVFLGFDGGARQAVSCAFFRPALGAEAGGDIRPALQPGVPIDGFEFPLDSWAGAA